MNWNTRQELNRAVDQYCLRCLRNGTCIQKEHRFVLVWNECRDDKGREIGMDFYCDDFAHDPGAFDILPKKQK